MLDRDTRYIRSVTPLPGLCLLLELESGSTVQVNFKDELHTVKYSSLEKAALWRDVETDGFNVIWGKGKITADVDELLNIALFGVF
jgi:hypothetical protein